MEYPRGVRVRHGVAVVIAVTGIAGCSVILGIEQKPLRPPDEAGVDARVDSGVAPDASAGPTSGCPLTPGLRLVFCDDFDDGGTTPAGRWDDTTTGAGVIDFDTSDSVSRPRSLRVSLASGSGSRASTIEKTIATTKQDVTVGFDLRVDGPASRDFGAIDYATIDLLPPPAGKDSHGVILFEFGASDPMIAYVQSPEAATETRSDLTPPLARGRWQRVVLRIALGGATPQVFVTLDGVLAGAVPIASVTLTGVVVTLGVDTAEAATTAVVHFDNVTVEEP